MNSSLEESLLSGAAQLNLELPAGAAVKMIALLHLLKKWNAAYNLTAITDLQTMLSHHLLDSLAIAPYITTDRILDVGSGAGFPGLPLALLFPQKQFVLLDGNGKKTRFLTQAAAELSIDNVEVIHNRVESFSASPCFNAIIFRAVGPISDLIKKTKHLCCNDGCYLMMKGRNPEMELQDVTLPSKVIPVFVPGLNAERHLVIIEGASRG